MNQSKTKAKVMMIAIVAIVFVCALFVISIVEIRQYHKLNQQILAQERELNRLNNAKDYYNSPNFNNSDGDLEFTEG